MELPQGKFGAILADPPWQFQAWAGARLNGDRRPVHTQATKPHYQTMTMADIEAMSVAELAADDCVLFLWICWPVLQHSLRVIESWGFTYKTCGFCWVKANAKQVDMFRDDIEPRMNLGYWTRSNSEVCLLATKGKPKRRDGGVRQAIIEPQREHSRKPDGIHERIEHLVAGPYLELFARQQRPNWTTWGNQTDRFAPAGTAA
jgi:N6-adenosine-specific RNA methylase IME4